MPSFRFPESCDCTNCKRKPVPHNCIKTKIGNFYYCDKCWPFVQAGFLRAFAGEPRLV